MSKVNFMNLTKYQISEKLWKWDELPRMPLKDFEISQTFYLLGKISFRQKEMSTESLRENALTIELELKIPRKGKREKRKKYKINKHFVLSSLSYVLNYLGFFNWDFFNPKNRPLGIFNSNFGSKALNLEV